MLTKIDDLVWGVPMIVLILAVGILLTIRLKGLQITKLPLAIKHIIANEKGCGRRSVQLWSTVHGTFSNDWHR